MATGLVQWTPKSSLINHASAIGISDYNNGDNQCQVIIQEIIGASSIREWYTTSAFISNYYNSGASSDMIGITGDQFLNNSMNWTADKLAIMFMAGYERPSYDPNTNHYQARMTYALNWKQYMQGIIPPPTPVTPAPIGDVYSRFSKYGDYYGTLYAYTNSLNDSQKETNATYIMEYFLDKDFTVNPIIVLISCMDLISTLNPGYWEYGTEEADYGLLGWRKWEFTDYVFANSEFVWDYQDPSVIDNSLGRIEWFAKYNLGWDNSTFTLNDWLHSEEDPDYLATLWVQNYVYNELLLTNIRDRIDYWKGFFQLKSNHWKWLYGRKHLKLT